MRKIHPIGKEIKEFRMARGWSQHYAAVQLGIGLRTLISFESGEETHPRPLTLAKIAFAMRRIEKAA